MGECEGGEEEISVENIENHIDAEPDKFRRVFIPDCGRDDLPQFFVNQGFKVGAEIGTYKGEYAQKFCEVGLRLYCIDPWAVTKDYHYDQTQKRQDFLYDHTKRLLAKYDNCTILRKTSMEALNDFGDESLDFVYIDGNHSFKYIAEDICEWTRKIKKGGIISGHDYANFGVNYNVDVKEVVDAYVKARHVEKWYVLGRTRKKVEDEVRDRYRSWMWFIK